MKERRPSTSDSVIKILSGLTILALLVQGILMLHWQVTTLSAQKPKKYKLRPGPDASRSTHPRGPSGMGSRIQAAFQKYKASPKPKALPSGGGQTEVFSKEGIIDVYRGFYNKQGIRDEEYIIVMALERGDAAYTNAIVAAQKALETNNYEAARDAIRQALDSIDERHLFARGRLLKMLAHIEFRAADPEAGRATQREADELAIELAKILIRGSSEKRDNTLSAEDADAMIAALSDERDMRNNIAKVGTLFSGQGEDPDQAPQRIMAVMRLCIEHGDKAE